MAQLSDDIKQSIIQAANKYGVSPETLMRIAMVESGGNPNARNPKSTAGGLFQFIDSTAKQYDLNNKFDPMQAADAAARLTSDNAQYLRNKLGREPTAGELYLAHQQGAQGAVNMLTNPNASASNTVGSQAIGLNGGHNGMTNGQFANMWSNKFDGSTPQPSLLPASNQLGRAGHIQQQAEGYGQPHPVLNAFVGKEGILSKASNILQALGGSAEKPEQPIPEIQAPPLVKFQASQGYPILEALAKFKPNLKQV